MWAAAIVAPALPLPAAVRRGVCLGAVRRCFLGWIRCAKVYPCSCARNASRAASALRSTQALSIQHRHDHLMEAFDQRRVVLAITNHRAKTSMPNGGARSASNRSQRWSQRRTLRLRRWQAVRATGGLWRPHTFLERLTGLLCEVDERLGPVVVRIVIGYPYQQSV